MIESDSSGSLENKSRQANTRDVWGPRSTHGGRILTWLRGADRGEQGGLGLSRRGGGQIEGNVGVLQFSEQPSYYVIRWTQHRRPPQSSQGVGLPGGRPDFMLMLMLSDSLSDSWKSRPCALALCSPDAPP